MRRFLRFLMLVLMATWGTQGYADVVKIIPTDCGDDGNSYTIPNGDITLSMSPGLKDEESGHWPSKKHKDVEQSTWDVGSYGGTFGDETTLKLPVGADFTVTCNKGYVDYVLISFNNGSITGAITGRNHSEHWGSIYVNGNSSTNTKGDYYHTVSYAGRDRRGWWGGYGNGVSSVTFEDTRTSTDEGDEQTQGWLWIYVFYHKDDSLNPAVTLNGNDFDTEQTTVTATSNWTNSIENWDASLPMLYTIDGSDPSTSGTEYSNGIPINCTRKVQVLTQARLKLSSYKTECKSSSSSTSPGFSGLPSTYNPKSNVHYITVTKYCKVTLNGAGLATFAHNNNMTLTTESGCTAAAYKITNYRKGNGTPSVLAPIKPYFTYATNGYKVIPANTPVILFNTNKKSKEIKLTNPLNDDPSNDGGTQTVSGNILQGNFSYGAATATNNSQLDFYYLMQEYQGSNKYGFYWGAADGRPASLGAHKAYFTVDNTARKSGSGAKGFVFEMPDDETTGIAGVFVNGQSDDRSLDADAPMYNAAGQRVGAGYKGLVIQNGRKFIKR